MKQKVLIWGWIFSPQIKMGKPTGKQRKITRKSIFIFFLTDNDLISAGRFASLSACVRCPPCFDIQVCSQITLNFYILHRFVILEGGQRRLVLHFVILSNSFPLNWGQLVPSSEDALPFCPFRTFPHTVGNNPPPS